MGICLDASMGNLYVFVAEVIEEVKNGVVDIQKVVIHLLA
jgi:hypothetical protein